jgi:fucose permease
MDSHGNPKLILYKFRWVVLICFTLSLVSIGMLGCTCTTTASLVKEIYNLSVFGSNLANFAYSIMYIPGNFISIFVLRRYGVKISIVIGALLFITGA